MGKKLKTAEDYVAFLKKASDSYYNSDSPIISDDEFDSIRDEFELKFPSHPYLDEVGALITSSNSKKDKHSIPMGSLQKSTEAHDLYDWYKKNGDDGELVWSEKIDGLSVSVTYVNGKLLKALTRGDGTTGEDITKNVLKMKIPQLIPYNGEVILRGEIFLAKSSFKKHFQSKDKVSSRNAAVGSVKRLDGNGCEHLDILFYNVFCPNLVFKNQSEKLEFITAGLTLKTPSWGIANNIGEVIQVWEDYEKYKRESSDYEMDGLVIDINNIVQQEKLGFVSNRPKFSRAYKFTSQSARSTIESIHWQVGRTGRITPVARISPVFIAGAKISNVTLHNLSEIHRLGIKVGQTVLVRRSGDVIPQIVSVITASGEDFFPPEKCPSCGEKTVQEDVFLKCNNEKCEGKTFESLVHWIKTLEIKGFGDELIRQLVCSGKLATPVDFYRLTESDISSLDGRGEKSAKKVLAELHSNKSLSVPVFIKALGIEGIGKTVTESILSKFPSLDKILEISDFNEITSVRGIGEITAKGLIFGLRSKSQIISELLNYITIKEDKKFVGRFSGLSFCFSGFRDKSLEKKLLDHGGRISSSVTKDLSYLIVLAEDEHSTKISKAKNLGVKIIDLAGLIKMMET